MKHVLLLFLDGVGLGDDDPDSNPFARAHLPHLESLLDGQRLLAATPRHSDTRASFVPTDAQMGVAGLPQSATGQAAIVTGRNVPQMLGKHWGPKPNAEVRAILEADNIFQRLARRGFSSRLANAYPPRYFQAIESGRRMYSAIPLAVASAGIPLFTADDLRAGRAFSADFTGEGWRSQLQIAGVPVYTPFEAGQRLAHSARRHSLLFFEHWPTDYTGHRGTMDEAVALLERLDAVAGGILDAWDDKEGLFLITSDHGNLEDMSTRRHTQSRVPTVVVGPDHADRAARISALPDLTPLILGFLDVE